MKPPPRPRSERPDHLGFTPQPMVQWLAPGELLSAAMRVVLSGVFGAYADKRELQGVWPVEDIPDYAARSELWLDYVADVADGFDATMTVASVLARPDLVVPEPPDHQPRRGLAKPGVPRSQSSTALELPRGDLLVMGGDQVYPTADYPTYRDRLIGPYRAALPDGGARPPDLYAIPGNHDWYDGLTSFIRVFCQGAQIGGWRTRQDRSYFAVRLPHGWWLWGIDTQFDSYLDPAQLHYFRDVVGAGLQEGDSVILCQAEPSWVKASLGEPNAYEHVDFVQREIVEPRGAQVRMALAGDHHHYARYQADDGRQLITAGGGGAYLAATHHLPEQVHVPPKRATDIDKSQPTTYGLERTYPSRRQSRSLRAGVLKLPFKNGSFWAVVGVTYVVLGWSVLLGLRASGQGMDDLLASLQWDDLLSGLYLRPLGFLLTVLLVLGLVAFNGAPGPKRRWGFGISHVIAHEVLILATILGLSRLLDGLSGGLYVLAVMVGLGVVGSLLGSWLVALYLLVADRFSMNTNELFAAQHIEGFNNFLRMHIDQDGALTLYPVGIERAATWKFQPEGRPEDPWFEPRGPAPEARLIERPVRLERLPEPEDR